MKTLILGLILLASATASFAELTPDQLNPAEQKAYATLSGDASQRYLVTRDYLRQCQAAVKSGNYLGLDDQPFAYDTRYVSAVEQALVKKAIKENMLAWLKLVRRPR